MYIPDRSYSAWKYRCGGKSVGPLAGKFSHDRANRGLQVRLEVEMEGTGFTE